VCQLCTDTANEHGWIKEGTPTTPLVADSPRRRRRLPGLGFLEPRREEAEPVVSEPVLRRLSPPEQAMVEAAELFNGSPYSRTIAGIAKSLGEARVSILPLSGVNTEVVITIAWDISWYQYRVVFDSSRASTGTAVSRRASPASSVRTIRRSVIYCVIPPELEDELYDRLVEHYNENPNVTVIVDRRTGPDRRSRGGQLLGGKRQVRDRRRGRIPGTFPRTDPPEG
jgi:hypothetical protein